MDSFVLFFLIPTLGSILILLSNNSCPPIFILGSKVGIDRTDSLGTGTVVFRVLSRWYSSTRRRCGSSTVPGNRPLLSVLGRWSLHVEVCVKEERQIGRGTDRKQIVDADGFILVRGKEKRNKSHVDGYVAGTKGSEEQNKRKIVSWSLP